ncbi:MAG TPA: lipid A deacylase LpxR family protein [Magnetovibrio sp.]
MPINRPLHFRLILAIALVASGPVTTWADEADGSSLLIQWDNDKVVDTDRHYTNGMRIAYSIDHPTGQWKSTGEALAGFSWFTDQGALRTGWIIGQDMYTPEDVASYTPDPTDRPYAGWSFLGISVQNETSDIQDTMEIDVGIIGPAARAGQTQNAFHRLINVPVSHGWRSQIHNEAGLLATRTRKMRSPTVGLFDQNGLEADVIGHGTVQLGNIRTGAALGATVRLGGNLTDDFGPVYGTFALPTKRASAFSYSFFVGAEARAVAWDVFLDGNTFKDSPDVKKNPYVLEGRVGFAVLSPLPDNWWIKGIRTSVNMVHRTREFASQTKADRYGSLQITLNY